MPPQLPGGQRADLLDGFLRIALGPGEKPLADYVRLDDPPVDLSKDQLLAEGVQRQLETLRIGEMRLGLPGGRKL